MKKLSFLFVVFSFIFVVSCGDDTKSEKSDDEIVTDTEDVADDDIVSEDTDVSDEAVTEEEPEVDEVTDDEAPVTTCADVAEGMNTKFIAGEGDSALERDFIIRFPESLDSQEEWPVVFLFHGYGDSASNFESLLAAEVDNSTMPFILVVPEARADLFTFGVPPTGLDWDMIILEDGSAEVDLFDSVLECIDTRWGVDDQHVHLSGFSAGSITADSIALMRPEKIASIATYSGAYFSNPDNRADLGTIMGMNVGDFFSWPDFAEEHNKYTQVLISGAEGKDIWSTSGFTIEFDHMATFDANYLTSMGHNVIRCNHGGSHTVKGLTRKDIVQFFSDHPFGTEVSPYKDGLPTGWEICEYRDQPVEIEDDSDVIDDSDSEVSDI